MLKIRLMRIGAKKRPFYRVVAVDERSKRTGGYIELLGTYDPMTNPHDVKLKQDRIDHWVKQGAQLSDGFLRVIGKAPQRPPRKPKKEKVAQEEKVPQVPQGEETKESTEAPAAESETSAAEQPAETPTPETTAEAPTEETEAPAPEAETETAAAEEAPAEVGDGTEQSGDEAPTAETTENK